MTEYNDKDLLDAIKLIADHHNIDIESILTIANNIKEQNKPLLSSIEKRWKTDDEVKAEKLDKEYCRANVLARLYVGKKVSHMAINDRLVEVGLAERDSHNKVIPTSLGAEYGVVSRSGKPKEDGYIVPTTSWLPSVRHLLGDF